jgi:hypothetical protein
LRAAAVADTLKKCTRGWPAVDGELFRRRTGEYKMSSTQDKPKEKSLLTSMAESIGSTLGTIAAKASTVPDAISHSSLLRTTEREGKKLVRKSKTAARKVTKNVLKRAKSRKSAKTTRHSSAKANKGTKRLVRRASSKKRVERRGRRTK